MYIILTFFDTFPWEKGENVLGRIQKIRRTGEDVKKKNEMKITVSAKTCSMPTTQAKNS